MSKDILGLIEDIKQNLEAIQETRDTSPAVIRLAGLSSMAMHSLHLQYLKLLEPNNQDPTSRELRRLATEETRLRLESFENDFGLIPEECRIALRENGKIPAIKALRARTDLGLKEAKARVDAFVEEAKKKGARLAPAEPPKMVVVDLNEAAGEPGIGPKEESGPCTLGNILVKEEPQSTYRRVQYKEWDCCLTFSKYVGGQQRMALEDWKTGEPVSVCTVALEEHPQAPGEVFIKDWSENKGMMDALVKAGIIEDTGKRLQTGYVEAIVARLLIEPY